MAIDRDALLGWMRRILSMGDTPETKVHLLVLKYVGPNDKTRDDVDRWEMRRPGSTKLIMDVEQACDHIIVTCEKEADDIGGTVRFKLFAYAHPSMGDRAVGTKRLRCYAPLEEDDEDELGMSIREEGTGRDKSRLEQESHRRIMELYMKGVNDNQVRLRLENSDLRAEIATLRKSYLGMIVTFERLKNDDAARNIALQESQQRTEIVASVGEKLVTHIPAIVNWYFKLPVMKQEVNPVEDMLKEALMPLKPDQLMGIMSHLDPTQRGIIQKMYMGWIEEEEKKKLAAAKKLPMATPSKERPAENTDNQSQS